MPATRGRNSRRPWGKSCPTSRLTSSSAPITPKDLWCCPSAGSSSAPLRGSTAAEGLPKIGRTSIARRSLSCASLQSASCFESFAIPLDVPGQSLRDAVRACKTDRDAVAQLVLSTAREAELSDGVIDDGFKERVALRLERVEAAMTRQVSRGVGILATIGATAPFVGLFGTVWGIMNSFIGISESHTTNLAVVAPGIAEALLATALGLVAAIPAVVIYNHLTRSIAAYRALLGDAAAQVLLLISREGDRRDFRIARAAE